MKKYLVEIAAILTLGVLVGLAMHYGYNGSVLVLGLTAIAGIAGYAIKKNGEGK